jgi:hypothetical protein
VTALRNSNSHSGVTRIEPQADSPLHLSSQQIHTALLAFHSDRVRDDTVVDWPCKPVCFAENREIPH